VIQQYTINLKPYPRGFHLITTEILQHIQTLPEKGILHVFIKHTSAGLTINENADPTVRMDFESSFNQLVPENAPYYKHNYEGSDDMPAHIKSSLVGSSVSIPISNQSLNLGTWQGVYLCEFRNQGGSRKLLPKLYHSVRKLKSFCVVLILTVFEAVFWQNNHHRHSALQLLLPYGFCKHF